jgi:glycosyltransferase involved in cell wall biosynthesis
MFDAVRSNDPRAAEPQPLFVIISFEGPDRASQAGGLGVRVSGLAETIAALGHEVHLFFIGDPSLPGEERRGTLVLHRWGQWISANCPGGVYDAEEYKRADLNASLPGYLTDHLLAPAIRAGRPAVVLSEEWQTAECASLVSDRLTSLGLRDRVVMAWNANNSYSFDRIDWPRLAGSNLVTTVSRYMRSIIRASGVDAIVVPNGIPDRLTRPVDRSDVRQVRTAFRGAPFFFKMARWGDDKGWSQALRAVRLLRENGDRTVLVARSGGPVGNGGALEGRAGALGLRVRPVDNPGELQDAAARTTNGDADVLSLRFGVSEDLARTLFAAADGVLANSVSEPFGLVGLEAMAAGGVLYTGGTGEDYAISGRNAVVLETLQPGEIVDHARRLASAPDKAKRIRRAARESARDFSWQLAIVRLFRVLDDQGRRQGLRLGLVEPSVTPIDRANRSTSRSDSPTPAIA